MGNMQNMAKCHKRTRMWQKLSPIFEFIQFNVKFKVTVTMRIGL